ncbi:hypothetical protein [Desulfoluna butyratoxydans]|uniref:Uncharacterized protein n=1 Tax=Desulfoluna butyratoxydans TaxID=231438 RepID=A0A4U8YNR3_9BACT|nr:hypothetical protein [Desulfoluna butyratoxydans]VFQ45766.1 hypothetical protein MSL71_34280 [Desulfoluna butyratoxydans]
MKRVKLMVGVGLIFSLGALAGFFTARQVTHHKVRRFVHGGPPAAMIIARMVGRIDLTPDQGRAIDPILTGLRGELVELHDRSMAEVNAIIRRRYSRIVELLTPSQYQLLLAEGRKAKRFNMFRTSWRLPWADKSVEEVMEELTAVLSLTPDQQEALKPLVARRVKAQKVVARVMLTSDGFDSLRMERAAEGGDEMPRPIQDVLTPEQLEAYWLYRTGPLSHRGLAFKRDR